MSYLSVLEGRRTVFGCEECGENFNKKILLQAHVIKHKHMSTLTSTDSHFVHFCNLCLINVRGGLNGYSGHINGEKHQRNLEKAFKYLQKQRFHYQYDSDEDSDEDEFLEDFFSINPFRKKRKGQSLYVNKKLKKRKKRKSKRKKVLSKSSLKKLFCHINENIVNYVLEDVCKGNTKLARTILSSRDDLRKVEANFSQSCSKKVRNCQQENVRTNEKYKNEVKNGLKNLNIMLAGPISQSVMNTPSILVETGCSFDLDLIVLWLEKNSCCPLTGKKLQCKKIYLNNSMKSIISKWKTIDFSGLTMNSVWKEKENSIEKVKKDVKEKLKKCLKCKLSGKYFIDPVTLSSGESYEKKYIKRYLKNNTRDPKSKKTLRSKEFSKNILLRNFTEEWKKFVD